VTIIIGVPYPASFWHALKLKATNCQAFATQAEAKYCDKADDARKKSTKSKAKGCTTAAAKEHG
jgi:hypothetical protein